MQNLLVILLSTRADKHLLEDTQAEFILYESTSDSNNCCTVYLFVRAVAIIASLWSYDSPFILYRCNRLMPCTHHGEHDLTRSDPYGAITVFFPLCNISQLVHLFLQSNSSGCTYLFLRQVPIIFKDLKELSFSIICHHNHLAVKNQKRKPI